MSGIDAKPEDERDFASLGHWRIVLAYAAFAALWIGLSDMAVSVLAGAEHQAAIATIKGWVFVAVTAVLLFGLVRRLLRRQRLMLEREREAVRSLERTSRLLSVLVESSPDAIFAKDLEGRYLIVNREAARLMGLEVPQFTGRGDAAVFPAEQAAMIRMNDERVMALSRPETFEEDLDTTDGRRTFLTTKGPLRDAHGNLMGVFGISRDVTGRVAAQRLLGDVLARVEDGLAGLDREWRYTYVTPKAARMLGCENPEDLIGRCIWEVFPEGPEQTLRRGCETAMETQRPVILENHYHRWDRWFENRIYPSPEGLSVYFTEITERKRTQLALRAYQQELSDLTRQLLLQEKATTQRIAQALHDNLGQTLAVARLHLDVCVSMGNERQSGGMAIQCNRVRELLDDAIREVRQVLTDLRPPLLENQGLAAALDNEIAVRSTGSGPDVLLEVADEAEGRRWPAEVEYCAFMVAREALANAQRHAGASLVRCVLDGDEDTMSLAVVDDGEGIDASLVKGRPGHLGIVGMRERAAAIGAIFEVTRGALGGTHVSLLWRAGRS
ncbi:hypothetical protein BH09PSE5_BH09PSE5_34510 [soil metagenome]